MRFLLLSGHVLPSFLLASSLVASPVECHAIDEDTLRLSCYDRVTEYSPPEPDQIDQEDPADFGEWSISERRSEMTDFQNIFASLSSENQVWHQYDFQRRTGRARLLVRCMDNRTALTIGMDGKFLADNGGYGSVSVRIDDATARTYRFRESTDNMVLGLWRGSAIPLLKNLIGAEEVRFEITPFNESAQVMRFDVRGIDNVIARVRDRCSW